MSVDKKSLAITAATYVIWGILPIYWQLLGGVNSLLVLCCRIIFSLIFTIVLLGVSGNIKVFRDTLLDKASMRWLIPAAVIVTFNWGLFIWAVNSGHVIECSLGYYINPLLVFLIGVLLLREKFTRLQLVAVALAFVGVLISVLAYGVFPVVSITLALTFAVYGVLKKKARVEPVAGIAIETLVITPFALAFALLFMMDGILNASLGELLLLAGAGVATAVPLIMFSRSVNNVPFIIVGFFQYISPSLMLIYGIISGEAPSTAQLISLIFTGLGLVVFSIALVRGEDRAFP